MTFLTLGARTFIVLRCSKPDRDRELAAERDVALLALPRSRCTRRLDGEEVPVAVKPTKTSATL